jgi:hypothetical protein
MSEFDTQGDHHDFSDPERFVDPSTHEIDEAREEAEATDMHDPKGPRFHSTHADLWDQREGK